MAELAAAASVLGVASFGLEVAKLLYNAGDVLVNAHGQIDRLAKHVSHFSHALHHMGWTLKQEGEELCSKRLLREIQSVVGSCQETLREIRDTILSVKDRRLQSIKWLFKKDRAKELQAQLDSYKSTLQIMMHTVIVSRISQPKDKLKDGHKEDDELISNLRAEIAVMQTLIIENHRELKRWQRVEARNLARLSTSEEPLSKETSSHYEASEKTAEDGPTSEKTEPPSSQLIAIRSNHALTSDMFLQMVPYHPPVSGGRDKIDGAMLSLGSEDPYDQSVANTTSVDEALESTFYLLDKWTITGSEAVFNIIGTKLLEDSSRTPEDSEPPEIDQPSNIKHERRSEHSSTRRVSPSQSNRGNTRAFERADDKNSQEQELLQVEAEFKEHFRARLYDMGYTPSEINKLVAEMRESEEKEGWDKLPWYSRLKKTYYRPEAIKFMKRMREPQRYM